MHLERQSQDPPQMDGEIGRAGSSPAELGRKANETFQRKWGEITGDSFADVMKFMMGKVKTDLKADMGAIQTLLDTWTDPATFFPNRFLAAPELTKGNGGIVGVNTFPLLCHNWHLKNEGGIWTIDEATNTVGGDPTMPLIQAAALGWKTQLVTLVPDDAEGKIFIDRIQDTGVKVHPVWIEGEHNPLQVNFASGGEFRGIRLRKMGKVANGKMGEAAAKLAQVLSDIEGDKFVLVGGASNSIDSQNAFGLFMNAARQNGARTGYDPKDSHIGEEKDLPENWKVGDVPLVRNYRHSDFSKPNEAEAYILEQLLVHGNRNLEEIKGNARNPAFQMEYWNQPERLVEIYKELREVLGQEIGVLTFSLGTAGVVKVTPDLEFMKYNQPSTEIMSNQGLSIRSPQGGGNALWAGMIMGLTEGRPMDETIQRAQQIGLISTHQLGNGCALPEQLRKVMEI